MTINGAIMQLVELHENSMMPEFFKPSIQKVIETISEVEEPPKWTPVEEGLPKEGQKVLVWYEYFRYGDYNCMFQTYGISHVYKGLWMGDVQGTKSRCLAWMPLPPIYESEE